ncbi:TolC family protein [Lutibacter sp. TH_r2]|uniref:TolC family protein n=1 Tax=Lutibacter sp. TH_r2 TaxID=3082083 RepID=UPI002955B916|nr:TolC family protein [Lutibacter sp. TH_r2]MDV7186748.1 TolC family protein [Lutibacter sp. TH_r2]
MKQILILTLSLLSFPVLAQQTISLQECYDLMTVNYPLVKQTQFLETQNQLDTKVITNAKLPQFNIDAQATYQSDVIEFPLAMSGIEPLNKDQYRATLSVNQLIYNGGSTNASLKQKNAQLKTKQQQIKVNLYKLKQQINQLYFSILLSQEINLLLKAKETQLKAKLKEVKSGVKYGVLLPASDKVLEAELLKINQQLIELQNNKIALIETLSSLISQPLNSATNFNKPLIETKLTTNLNRPELELFQFKKDEIESSKTLISKQNAPKILGFATGGYGNPGLNMLDNSFQTFYTVGVKLNWNVFDWNTNKKQQKSLAVNKDIIDNEAEIFRLNTSIELNKQQKEIEKIKSIITSDIEIVKLRKEVLKTADSQLKNGVITSSAYITELTNLYEDENTLVQHNIQLQLAKANYNIIKGY